MKISIFCFILFFVLTGCGRDKSLDHQLLNAAALGNYEKVDRMLRSEADVNARDEQGWTPLMYAASYGDKRIVQLLIEYKADLNIQNDNGNTAADIAQYGKRKEIVDLLLSAGGKLHDAELKADVTTIPEPQPASTTKEIPIDEIVLKGSSMNETSQFIDKSIVAEAKGDPSTSALLSNAGGDVARWRFALNGKQYELNYSRSTIPWGLSEIIEKDFNPADFPSNALIKPASIKKKSEEIIISKTRIFQDPNGSDYAGWETHISFKIKNSGDQPINEIPFAVIAYNRYGEPNSLARFGPGAGQYTFWGVIEGELPPSANLRTEKISLGILYEKPTRVKIILLTETLEESGKFSWSSE